MGWIVSYVVMFLVGISSSKSDLLPERFALQG